MGGSAPPAKMRSVPRPLPVMLAVLAAGALAPLGSAGAQEPTPIEVVLEGKGFGHGVGMAQEGAYAMAVAGAAVEDILAHFYPGTALGQRSGGTITVHLLERPVRSVVVRFPSGGEVRAASSEQPPGFPVSVNPGGSVRLSYSGQYEAAPLDGATPAVMTQVASTTSAEAAAGSAAQASTTTTTIPTLLGLIPLPPAAPPPTTAPPETAPPAAPAPEAEPPGEPTSGAPLLAVPSGETVSLEDEGRVYRGTVQATAVDGGLQLLNDVEIEEYLQGMGEVLDPSWPAAALQAQAIAARTYALQTLGAGRPLCSSQMCQVYLGQQAEYGAMSRAVAATTGQVLLYQGALAEAVYSANGGGISATPEEGFGHRDEDYPYLKSVSYPTQNPDPWEYRITLDQLAARMGYPGQATALVISRTGPSGRVLELNFVGEAGNQSVEGRRLMEVLGLRSTLFQLRMEGGANAVPGAPANPHVRAALSRLRRDAPVVLAAGDAESPRGRAPWTAFSVLLLAAWGTAAVRYRHRAGARSTEATPMSAAD